MSDSAFNTLVELYRDHFAGRHSAPVASHPDQDQLRSAKFVTGTGQRPRITWMGIRHVERTAPGLTDVINVQGIRKAIVAEGLKLGQKFRDGRFQMGELASNLGMSEEQWIPHVIESPFFDGRGITIGFFKVTEAGRRLA